MKIKFLVILLFLQSVAYTQTTYFIKYKNTVTVPTIETMIKENSFFKQGTGLNFEKNKVNSDFFAGRAARNIDELNRIVKLILPGELSPQQLENYIHENPEIEYIQKSTTYRINSIPNDSLINQQWALTKIDAFSAWSISKGSDTVLVAVIDTGIDYLHPDLKNKVFINSGEFGVDAYGNDKRYNGIDDDNNGFIDDYMGWDFTDRVGFPFDSTGGDYLDWDNDPMDENNYSHGTAVAGIIGAETNNGIGIAGVAPNIKVLNLRSFDPAGYGEEDDVAAAIIYAVQMGVKVINMSFGDYSFSYVLRDVIRYAYSQNVVLVASAGNSNSPDPHYPSGYSEVISVGNSTKDDYVAAGSNYGSTLDLVAPGTEIMTTIRNEKYSGFNGTSAAAPFITASAALILSKQSFTNEEVKQILKSTADDIGEAGWDLKSGAGRLNLNKALAVLAPSVVKVIHPTQDFATGNDTINIFATALSPFFSEYNLFIGEGLNPTSWQQVIANGKNQFSNHNIFNVNLSNLFTDKDTTYTIRLVVHQSNGKTIEERVNFHRIKTPPDGEIITLGQAYYGNKPTVMAALYTKTPCVVRMYFKEPTDNSFQYITLDGFAMNNQFVKQAHYGFIPKQLVKANTNYDIYFEIENLVGLKTTIKDSLDNFRVKTDDIFSLVSKTELSYSLPPGIIFDQPVNFTSNTLNEVMVRENSNSKITSIYQLQGSSLVKIDSMEERIPKEFGDFNNNGKKDLLSFWYYNSFIYEQENQYSSKLVEKSKKDGSTFWPIMAKDINGNGVTELLAIINDSTISVNKLNSDLSISHLQDVENFTSKWVEKNLLDSPNAIVVDSDNNGQNELWMVDADGDIFSYKIASNGELTPDKEINTFFAGSSAYITSGDFTGDGKKEIAVLLHSIDNYDVANYHLLVVFNFSGNDLNIVYQRAFIDPANEFRSAFQKSSNSVKLVDIDNDSIDELVFFAFPYAYILKYEQGKPKIIFYEENVNSTSVLSCDLNQNGVIEIAIPLPDKIKFYEFGSSLKPLTPSDLIGYSRDSNSIKISWNSNESFFYVYRGDRQENMTLIDSTSVNYLIDTTVLLNKDYYYAVQSFNTNKQILLSDLSSTVKVYHHKPAEMKGISVNSSNSVLVTYDEKISTTIENLEAFELKTPVGLILYPNSISPANQYAYLVTFKESFDSGLNWFISKKVRDHYGSQSPVDSISFQYTPVTQGQEFFIESYELLNQYNLKITFNLNVDPSSTQNINNYVFEPSNNIGKVTIDETDSRTIYLKIEGEGSKPLGAVGIEYRLQINNLFSSSTTGSIKINEGAGSVIVVSVFANDISDVYFYPSPAKIDNGNGIVTFANLPQFAEITIWDLNGKRIITLNEKDGDGGLKWDFKDLNGKVINSGIYLYRLVMLDSKNQELDTKLGKIAVVK